MGRGRYFRYTVKEPSSETLLRLAELVLTLNCFSFGGNYYKQTNGVAMGTKMGPSYANLFVGFIEHQFFSQYQGPKPNSTAVTLTTASALPPLPARTTISYFTLTTKLSVLKTLNYSKTIQRLVLSFRNLH